MKNKVVFGLGIFFFILIFLGFKAWFLPGVITGGDLWYFSPSMYGNHSLIPFSWVFFAGNGFGGPSVLFSAVNFVFAVPFFFGKHVGVSWDILERFFILFPFLILAGAAPAIFTKKIFPKNTLFFISSLIFLFNTYILMLVSGGLVVIGIAYSLIPLTFLLFIKILSSEKNKLFLFYSLTLGLVLGIQSILDMRVTYVTFSGLLTFLLVDSLLEKRVLKSLKLFLFGIIVPAFTSILINAFWIIPAILTGSNSFKSLGDAYTSTASVKFFSFATFENSISLLHPNWPENIFGKIYFQRPEFLLLPIIAFGSLFFVKKENKKIILPLTAVSLLGSFLAKGANEPFGAVYLFLFEKIPGFLLFRDPTKWYMLVAVSFAILIPFTLFELYKKIGRFGFIAPLAFTFYFIFLINPLFLGKLPGTFQTSGVPKEYISFEHYLSLQQSFSRTLWIPNPSRFSYFSPNHPEVSGDLYFKKNNPLDMIKGLSINSLTLLGNKGVRYIIIPSDTRGEIFIKDRKYSEKEYKDSVVFISKNKNLKEIKGFGRLKIYENYFWNHEVKQENPKSVYPGIQQLTDLGALVSFVSVFLVLISIIYLKYK